MNRRRSKKLGYLTTRLEKYIAEREILRISRLASKRVARSSCNFNI